MGTAQRAFYDRYEIKTVLRKRWTVTVGEKVHGRWFSAITALAETERLIKEGAERVRFGWNIAPTKKARNGGSELLEMAELVENIGIREAVKVMNAEM